jgi:hypothetical protein
MWGFLFLERNYPAKSAHMARNAAVWASTSAAVVAGDISAIL